MKKNCKLILSIPLIIVLGSSCSSSQGGLAGSSGTRTSRSSDAGVLGGTQAKSSQSEIGQDSISGTANELPKGDTASQSKPTPIEVGISFQQWRGDASYTNCVEFAVNGGERITLGCNKDGNLSKAIKLTALPRPNINSVRVIFWTQSKERGTTQDGSANRLMRITKGSDNSFKIGYEDNSDGDFNDYIFSITTSGDVSLKIENCEKPECLIQ